MSTSQSSLPTTSTYIDLAKLTSPTFSSHQYANDLVRTINTTTTASGPTTQSESLVDLTTPLQKTLFDLQEIDTNIHTLTSKSALEILTYTQQQNDTARRILSQVDEERGRLAGNFERLQREVLGRYERAEKARVGAERSLLVLRLTRGVQRVLALARMFEGAIGESKLGDISAGKEDHRALLQATNVVLRFRELMAAPETDAMGLGRVGVVRQVRGRVFEDGEERLKDWARRVIREVNVNSFVKSAASTTTFGNSAEEAKMRFEAAVHVLYLLSPMPGLKAGKKMKKDAFEADDLLRSLQGYVSSAVSSSAAGIGRGLGQLPGLERALAETSGRCLSVRALEVVLGDIKPPSHPLLAENNSANSRRKTRKEEDQDSDLEDESEILTTAEPTSSGSEETVLDMLLSSLDTSSLTSYFWRTLASSLSSKVQEIMSRGGVSARTLKSNKDAVKAQIRECVLKGSKMPAGLMGQGGREVMVGNWEREAAVMVGSVVGPLGR